MRDHGARLPPRVRPVVPFPGATGASRAASRPRPRPVAMMAFDSRSTPEPRTISEATRTALAAAIVRLWHDPAGWQASGGEGRRVHLDAELAAAVDRMVREAQARALRAEEVIVAFKDLLGGLPELTAPERRLESAHFRERLVTECIRAYYAR